MNKFWVITPLVLLAAGCGLFGKKSVKDENEETGEWRWGSDSMMTWAPSSGLAAETELPNYRESEEILWTLQHTELSIKPDFLHRSLRGTAILQLSPFGADRDTLLLDAFHFEIHELKQQNLLSSSMQEVDLKYSIADSQHIQVVFPKPIPKGIQVQIKIEYTVRPYDHDSKGGFAITSDRGMYFINHDLSDGYKPRQMWTQGETESSSHWFPTLDAPNQKMSQRISITVPDTMITLSNGTLVQQKKNSDSTRTDIWEQKQKHAPYLTMVAAGNWTITKDQWRDKPVNYLLEKKYQPYAKLIFGNTPEMMEFFSNYTGVDYPWDKYSQVVCRDFVSGAMENTSAVVHMEQVAHSAREHKDQSYEDFISHELFHHWFGDLVTCESWSNLTLNESFATYGEYLWKEHFYGKDQADALLDEFRTTYGYSWFSASKPLVRYDYGTPDEIFDAISYQKGACILHMLRNTVGETAFREGLKLYLNRHKFNTAEVANLRMAMEESSGKDLNWFFNQWYFTPRHPSLELSAHMSENDTGWILKVYQTQSHKSAYKLPVKIMYGMNGRTLERMWTIINQEDSIRFDAKPEWWIFDADNSLLADIKIAQPSESDNWDNYIPALREAMNHAPTAGVRYNLYKWVVESVAQPSPDLELNKLPDSSIKAYHAMQEMALNSHFEPMVLLAIRNQNSHNHGLTSSAEKMKAIADHTDLSYNCRILALNYMVQNGFPQDSVFTYTQDTNGLGFALSAIEKLESYGPWVSYAKFKGLADKEPAIAVAWGKQLIRTDQLPADEVLTRALSNNAITPEYFSTLFFYFTEEVPESKKVPQIRDLFTRIKSEGRKNIMKVMAKNLNYELRRVEKWISEAEAEGKIPDTRWIEKRDLYRQIASEAMKP
ncbi:MAG: M1 family metallopeptidase [Bacteroidetes bacterium]|nr:M1 family metallopeptidase [Bacteroidota bacterium]